MAPMTLENVCRVISSVYFFRFALAILRPNLAQEYTDFCNGCDLNSDAGYVTGQHEAFAALFVGLFYMATSKLGHDRAMRTILCWGKALPILKLVVLLKYGLSTLGTENTRLLTTILSEVFLLGLAAVACHEWFKRLTPVSGTKGAFDLYAAKTGAQVAALEAGVLGFSALFYLYSGEVNQFRPNDAGVYGSANAAAHHLGMVALCFAASLCDEGDISDLLTALLQKKKVELLYLSILGAPFAIAAGGDNGLNGAYITTLVYVLTMVHLMCCKFHGPPRRAVFWMGSAFAAFLGSLGFFFPASTAAAFYRIPELAGSGANVYKLIGMGCFIFAGALYAFSESFEMDAFEGYFVFAYAPVVAWTFFHTQGLPELGVFSDLLNVFMVWCVYQQYKEEILSRVKPFVPRFFRKTVKSVVDVVSPKASPAKSPAAKSPSRSPAKSPSMKMMKRKSSSNRK